MTLRLVTDPRGKLHAYEPCVICGASVFTTDGMWWNADGTLHNYTCRPEPEGDQGRRVTLAAAGLTLNCDLLDLAAELSRLEGNNETAARLIVAAKQVRDAIRMLEAAAPGRDHLGIGAGDDRNPKGA